MIVLWLGVAWASQGVVVQVVDTRAALEASPLVELVDAAGTLHTVETRDDGVSPDAQAGDRTWSGLVDQVVGLNVVLTLRDDRAQSWSGEFELAEERSTLRVVPTADGGLRPWQEQHLPPPSPRSGIPPEPTWSAPASHTPASIPWGLLAWAAGLGLLALGLLRSVSSPGDRGSGGILSRVSAADEEARLHFLEERAQVGPLVIAGPAPSGLKGATVLGPGRVDVEDLLRTLESLTGKAQLVVTGVLEGEGGASGEAALVLLARGLPSHVEAFVLKGTR